MQQVEREFDLVMLVEYMAESVLLLKELICWTDFRDIVYLRSNSRLEKADDSDGPMASRKEKEADRIRHWNKADWALYQHFNRTFWAKVADYRG